jgi:CheY-like chemotaxis protein
MLTREQFIEQLREALNHLYETDRLRRSPLAGVFGVAGRFDSGAALQRVLMEAIASLKPAAGEPSQSPAWQIYEPLFYRYVEQLSAEEVADQLGIGTRHLRRWQNTAHEALADLLWRQYDLAAQVAREDGRAGVATPPASEADLVQELAWLKDPAGAPSTDLAGALPPLLDLVQRLAARHGVRLTVTIADALPRVGVVPAAFRQALINLFTVVIPRAAGGEVFFTVSAVDWDVELRIACAEYASGPQPARSDEADNLNMAAQLADLGGYRLTLAADARCFDARLLLPALEQIPVLAIDDSADALQLLARYAAGSSYRLVGTRDPENALALAEKLTPRIILLDVMMPQVDGWEMLGRLASHPATGEIPVVVCTILAQRDLALLMGASEFLRKPFTRAELLAVLDRLRAGEKG